MFKKIFSVLTIFLQSSLCAATHPPPAIQWEHSFTDTSSCTAGDIIRNDRGEYLIVGCKYPKDLQIPFTDVFILCIAVNGDTLWSSTYRIDGFVLVRGMCQVEGGGYILTGLASPTSEDDQDYWLLGCDEQGTYLWTKRYGSDVTDQAYGICPGVNGEYVVYGFAATGLGASDGWLLAIDALGDTLWSKAYGGKEVDYIRNMYTLSDGFLVAGDSRSYNKDPNLYNDMNMWVMKLTFTGDTVWSRTHGSDYDEWGVSIAPTSDGGYIFAGYTSRSKSPGGSMHPLVHRVDKSGNVVWTSPYDPPLHSSVPCDIAVMGDGSAIVAFQEWSNSNGKAQYTLLSCNGSVGSTEWSSVFTTGLPQKLHYLDGNLACAGITNDSSITPAGLWVALFTTSESSVRERRAPNGFLRHSDRQEKAGRSFFDLSGRRVSPVRYARGVYAVQETESTKITSTSGKLLKVDKR